MIEIPLTQGQVALIDDEDLEPMSWYKWHATKKIVRGKFYGYAAAAKIKKQDGYLTSILMHRFIMNPRPEQVVDHINHNAIDNRRSNLRVCTRAQNNCNARPRSDGVSRYKHVYFNRANNKWAAQIGLGKGKSKHLGYFVLEIDAAKAYDSAARKVYGEYAYTNFGPNGESNIDA